MIGLIAAMPDEIRPLLRRVRSWQKEDIGGFSSYRFNVHNRDILLLESGMGVRNAARAAQQLLAEYRPEILVNFGFAGAVASGLTVGDIVIAQRVLFRHNRLFAEQQGIAAKPAEQAASFLLTIPGIPFKSVLGTLITTSGILCKKELLGQLPQNAIFPAVDMETSAIAQTAHKEKVPLLAIRAISDGADEELQFSIEEFTDKNMKIFLPKVLLAVAKNPRIIPQLLRLSKNSKVAGENLATALLAILETV